MSMSHSFYVQEVREGVADLLLHGDSNNHNSSNVDDTSDDVRGTLLAVVSFLTERLGSSSSSSPVGCTGCELYLLPRPRPPYPTTGGSAGSRHHVVSVYGEVTCLDNADHSLLTTAVERGRIVTYTAATPLITPGQRENYGSPIHGHRGTTNAVERHSINGPPCYPHILHPSPLTSLSTPL